jgi:hypothetical protein
MDTVIVELVIGLAFLFFVLSIVASAIGEAISGALNLRGTTLHRSIANLLTGAPPVPPEPPGPPAGGGDDDDEAPPTSDAEIFWRVIDHPLVHSYAGRRRPSYLSSSSFRSALLDATRVLDAADLRAGLDRLPAGSHVRRTLTALARSVEYDDQGFRRAVEEWYDRSMERVSGWYKRNTQVLLFFIGVALALATNANAGQAAMRLWTDDGVRDALVAEAQDAQRDADAPAALRQLRALDFPIGWEARNRPDVTAPGLAAAIGGWVLTGIAITFGAPFWFDVLNRVSNLRVAGRRPASVLTPEAQDRPRTSV